jgi:precorrin-3B synthase
VKALEDHCPGVLHPATAKDGLLLRVRLPGGLVSHAQLDCLAAVSALGAGFLDITARANVQIRGVFRHNLDRIAVLLENSGLLPSRQHDRVRNIVASPLSGIDPAELIDCRPLIRQLDEELRNNLSLAQLPPKFSFAICGGGQPFDVGGTDLLLGAVETPRGLRFGLALIDADWKVEVGPEQAITALLHAATVCLTIAEQFEIVARGKAISTFAPALDAWLSQLSAYGEVVPARRREARTSGLHPRPSLGILGTESSEFVAIAPSIALGRLTATQMHGIAALAREYTLEVRFSTWRGLVIAGVSKAALNRVCLTLENLRVSVFGNDGYVGIAACAGTGGCASANADVRVHAARLAKMVSATRRSNFISTIHIAGCEKRCGMRTGADIEFIATPCGYNVAVGDAVMVSGATADFALDRAFGWLQTTDQRVTQLS